MHAPLDRLEPRRLLASIGEGLLPPAAAAPPPSTVDGAQVLRVRDADGRFVGQDAGPVGFAYDPADDAVTLVVEGLGGDDVITLRADRFDDAAAGGRVRSEYLIVEGTLDLGAFDADQFLGIEPTFAYAVPLADLDAVVVRGNAGDDVLTTRVRDGDYADAAGRTPLTVSGLDGDDEVAVYASSHALLLGGAGDDVLNTDAAEARLFGDAGDDRLLGGDGPQAMYGGTGRDTLAGAGGDDLLDGGAGGDLAQGGDGDDTLHGAERRVLLVDVDIDIDIGSPFVAPGTYDGDTLDGGEGVDLIRYDAVPTTPVNVDLDAGTATQAAATDTGGTTDVTDVLAEIEDVLGTDGDDTLVGDGNDNLLLGGGGDDALLGRGGDDTLLGNAGGDTLDGGAGRDVMIDRDRPRTTSSDLVFVVTPSVPTLFRGGAGIDRALGYATDDVIGVEFFADDPAVFRSYFS